MPVFQISCELPLPLPLSSWQHTFQESDVDRVVALRQQKQILLLEALGHRLTANYPAGQQICRAGKLDINVIQVWQQMLQTPVVELDMSSLVIGRSVLAPGEDVVPKTTKRINVGRGSGQPRCRCAQLRSQRVDWNRGLKAVVQRDAPVRQLATMHWAKRRKKEESTGRRTEEQRDEARKQDERTVTADPQGNRRNEQ